MPPKRVCSDKMPLGANKVRERPGVCFKKGLRAGFAAGIQKGTNQANEQGVKRARIVRAVPRAAQRMQDRRAEVVAQNPVAAPPAPIINIWDTVNRMGGKAQRGEQPTGGARNRDELIAGLVKNEPDLPQYTQSVSILKTLGKRVLINLLEGTGKYVRGREKLGRK